MNNLLLNNLKTTFRSLNKHRMSAVINIAGLALGMAACLVITFYVQEEMSYDTFYKDADRVYRLNTYWKQVETEEKFATSPPPLAPALAELSPDVEAFVRLNKLSDFTMRPDHDFDRPYRETNVWMVDKDFIKVLDNGVLAGDPQTMLSQPSSVVMPRKTAIRYFGQEAFESGNIVGRQLGGGGDGGTKWQVTGVIEDQPEQSHLQFDMLLSKFSENGPGEDIWGWLAFYSYVKLRDNKPETIKRVEEQLEYIVANYAVPDPSMTIEQLRESGMDIQYTLQPVKDIHLKSALLREMAPNGSLTYVRSMIIVAVFIMLLACVNFVNLTTAKSTLRAKEIGVRKVLGSERSQLIAKFLTESLVMTFISLLIALGLVEFFTNVIRTGFDWEISKAFLREPVVLLTVLGVTAFIGLLAGLYPAIYLTGFQPVNVLKGKSPKGKGEKGIRNGLVVSQFVISIGLIITTLIINQQVAFIRQTDLGFDKENVLVIQNDREIDERREEFKNYLRPNSHIIETGFSTGIPGLPQYMRRDFNVEGREGNMGINWFQADDSFLAAMDIAITTGRSFDQAIASDSSGLLLNESAVKELGLKDPIGTYVTINKGRNDEHRVQVIGVVEDFNLQSFDRKIGALAIEYLDDYDFKDYITIRLAPGNLKEAVSTVEAAWKEFEPNVPLVYSFLDNDFDRLFKSEQRLSKVFNAFTGMAIFIACLGLFGLAAYTNEQRTREISIRKVLGASISSLLGLLYQSYFRLILVSFVIAGGVAYLFAQQWLSNFVYRTQIDYKPFVLALLGTILIAAVTVVYQSLKTVLRNPVDTLKNE
ncbi:MAG: ABC transporter permease [Roseivirga sp.]